MFIRIAVFDPLPVFRRGVLATLGDAGFDADSPDDLMAWARDEERRLVLLTLASPGDWNLLAEILVARRAAAQNAMIGPPPSMRSYSSGARVST